MRRTALLCASLCALIAFLAVSSVGAQLPPHKFYGNDATVGGRAAPNGSIVRAVNESGNIVASATISGGAWFLDVDPRKARSVRFAIGASGFSGAYSVTSGTITNVGLALGGSLRVREPLEPPLVPGWELYTLQSGDTLTQLADVYGIPLDELLANNPHVTDPEELRAGDVVRLRRLHEIAPPPSAAAPTPLDLRVEPVPLGASPADPAALLGIAAPLDAPSPAAPPAEEAAADTATAPAVTPPPAATPDDTGGIITWQRLVLGVIAAVLLGLLLLIARRSWGRLTVPRTPPPARPRRRSTRFQRRGVIQSAPPSPFAPGPLTTTAPAAAPVARTASAAITATARPISVAAPPAAAGNLAVARATDPETNLEALRALLDSVRAELDALRHEVSAFRSRPAAERLASAERPAAAVPPQPADRRYFRTTPGADGLGPHGRGFPIGGQQPLRPVPAREGRLRAFRESQQRAIAQQSSVAGRIASLTDRAGVAWLRRG